jgi:hypothetical protein
VPGWTGYVEVCVQGLRPTTAQYAVQYDPSVPSIHWVNTDVEPAPSERTTGVIWRSGRFRSGLSALIRGSSQLVILLVKMPATTAPDSRRSVTRWPSMLRLYMNVVPPAASGM